MKNLLSMEHLTNDEIMAILERAREFENGAEPKLAPLLLCSKFIF